jgi:poly(glycerol-phosphate) alpha-glucosyltransferase
MLDPWAARNSAWKKAIALFFYENDNLRCAACIRALCQSEADSIRKFGLKNPICVIPNGIDLPVLDHRPSTIDHGPLGALKREGRKVLLYLGRIHPKKGLVNLLKAWAAVQRSEVGGQRSEWVLAIAGWDQGGHEAELKRLATELGILWSDTRAEHQGNSQLSTLQKQDSQVTQNQHIAKTTKSTIPRPSRDQFLVQAIPHSGMSALNSQLVFLGPQFNEDKATCYRDCDAFILPSFSEGLPMVVLEAWAYAKPVLITPECNLPEGFDTEAALRIEPTPENIAAGLRSLLAAPRSELQAIGQRGRTLVEKKFSWPTIAGQMKEVYDWVLGGGVKPESVQKAGLLTETLKS